MLRVLLASSALALTTSAAFAEGGHVPQPQPPVYVPPAVTDWSGAYIGLAYAHATGDWEETVGGVVIPFDWNDGTAYGGFAGYNWQNGSMVYGAEVGFWSVNDMYLLNGGTDDTLNSIIDVRARLGYAAGNALIYGAAGLSWIDNTINGTDENTLTGFNAGLGVDYQLTENFFLGADYTTRMVSGENNNPANVFDIDTTVNTLSLRVAYRF